MTIYAQLSLNTECLMYSARNIKEAFHRWLMTMLYPKQPVFDSIITHYSLQNYCREREVMEDSGFSILTLSMKPNRDILAVTRQ